MRPGTPLAPAGGRAFTATAALLFFHKPALKFVKPHIVRAHARQQSPSQMGQLPPRAPGSEVTHQLQFYVKPLRGEIKKKTGERFFKKKETSPESEQAGL